MSVTSSILNPLRRIKFNVLDFVRIERTAKMGKKVILYSMLVSPPCRSVLLCARAIGLPLEVREMDLLKRDHLTEEFLKMNPQHLIPTIDDNGFILGDSHSINCYLVDKYAKNDLLYPKDLQTRAKVNYFLCVDLHPLFSALRDAVRPILLGQKKEIDPERMNLIKETFQMFNALLEGKKWAAGGDHFTIADIALSVTSIGAFLILNIDDYPNLKSWYQRCEKEIPGFQDINVEGHRQFSEMLKKGMAA